MIVRDRNINLKRGFFMEGLKMPSAGSWVKFLVMFLVVSAVIKYAVPEDWKAKIRV